MKKFKFIAGLLLLIVSYSVTAQTCPDGTSSGTAFTSLGQARTVTSAGVYYFNLSGTTFSTYVNENGYVQVAIDFGNGIGNLPQGASLTNATRGILNTTALSRLTDANEVRISHSGGNLDVTTTNSTILSRIRSNTTIHRGSPDNGINNNWTGNQASAMTVDANCTTGSGNSLHQNVMHLCGPSSGFHWIPSTSLQRIRYSTGSFPGEIANNESLSLWVRAAADTNCYTSVPDDAFESYLEANGMGNGIANDNYVTTANISSKTSLVMSEQSISDLTGIEDFQSLTFLLVTGNNLTSVDLSNNTTLQTLYLDDNPLASVDISALTNLTSLNIGYNTTMSSLDVSNNVLLETLWLTGNTNMSTIDVSNNTALKLMHLARTRNFLSIDLKNNPNLISFYAFDSDVESVDLRNGNNTSISAFSAYDAPITCLGVDDVAYSVANWTSTDNSSAFAEHCNDTYVPDDNFEAFLEANGMGNGFANDNYVATANISSVTTLSIINQNGIADFTGIEDFQSLETFLVTGGTHTFTSVNLTSNTNLRLLFVAGAVTLSTLTVDNLTNLYHINAGGTNISSLNVSTNTALEDLLLSGTPIASLDLSNNSALKKLVLTETTNITTLDLRNNTNLINLFLENNNLETVDLRNGTNTSLGSVFRASNSLNLSCVAVDDVNYSVTNWASRIHDTSVFTPVGCNETYVPDDNFEAILEANSMGNGIANDNAVTTSNISGVTTLIVTGENISDLTGIEDFIALESLTATTNNISSVDLSNNTNLKLLLLSSNPIGAIDLSNLTNLEILGLTSTSITQCREH